eukprot:TRINITY_DN22384_c0_g1_i1.p2 TRINITY_DN22384_c0_g1~~TRINITY_DN22384_c0_g1_i1.p2  ORF type:complete len:113 (+),score=7.05 TRINITY_DN22384_c0_g1_i1:94-432(+)
MRQTDYWQKLPSGHNEDAAAPKMRRADIIIDMGLSGAAKKSTRYTKRIVVIGLRKLVALWAWVVALLMYFIKPFERRKKVVSSNSFSDQLFMRATRSFGHPGRRTLLSANID